MNKEIGCGSEVHRGVIDFLEWKFSGVWSKNALRVIIAIIF
jgi:hypothetical protein